MREPLLAAESPGVTGRPPEPELGNSSGGKALSAEREPPLLEAVFSFLKKRRKDMYLKKIREQKPLVHHITNYVVANETANLTLAVGALPVMAHAHGEVEEMVSMAGALLLNIGTMDEYEVESMLLAGKKANELGTPVILDPVGAGATSLRTDVARQLIRELRISAIRGNYGEISILAGYRAVVAGVESVSPVDDIETVVKELAHKLDCVVCATGKIDVVSDGRRLARVSNGHPALGQVTGTGCMATTMVAAHLAVAEDNFDASVYALAAFGIAGEIAYEAAGDNPGTFHQELYNAVYHLDDDTVAERKQVEVA